MRLNRTPLIKKKLRNEHGAFKEVIIFLYKHTLFVTNRGIQTNTHFSLLTGGAKNFMWRTRGLLESDHFSLQTHNFRLGKQA